jgi:nitrite reductase (NADH) large subunit
LTKYLIIGGGVTGVTAAQTILPLDKTAEVTILSAEPYPYYYRPRLWEYIAGQIERAGFFFRPPEWYEGQHIHLRLGAAVLSLQPAEHSVTLSNEEKIFFDRLLLATGARPFLPNLTGANMPGVFCLRSLDDAEAIRTHAMGGRNAVVVGGGLLGLETARAIASAGLAVTVLEMAPHLLPRQLDAEGAKILQTILEAAGLRIVLGATPTAVFGMQTVAGVQNSDGKRFDGNAVVFSTGILPNSEIARTAGLDVRRGIVADDCMQTSHADVFTAGDVAEHRGVVYGLIQPGIEQARVAAANMAGGSANYRGTLPAAALKIAGVEMASLGAALREVSTDCVLRMGSFSAGVYRKLVIDEAGRLVGAVLINEKINIAPIKNMIASRQDISRFRERLTDPDFNFLALSQDRLPEQK